MNQLRRYNLMRMSTQVELDPVMVMSVKHMFEWANQEGLRGKRVSGLQFIKPEDNPMGPQGYIMVNCIVHENEREEKDE